MVSLELQYRTNVQHSFCNQIVSLRNALVFRHCRLNLENNIISISRRTLFPEFSGFPHLELESTLRNQVYLFVLFAVYSTLISSYN